MTSTERGTPICSYCQREVMLGETGIRYFGASIAHSENRCIALLKIDLDRAQEGRDAAVKMLSEQDYEYNRKTNDLIERHAAMLTAARQEAEQRGRDAEELRADLEWLFNFGGIHGEEEFEDEIVYYFRLDGIEYRAPTWYEALKAARAALSPAREV